jgi:hypothetical protein
VSYEALLSKPPGFSRHRRKVVAPLDTSLLHHNAHLEKINQGFNPNVAAHGTPVSSSAAPGEKRQRTK